jgi:PAS domain S-box-containing protein
MFGYEEHEIGNTLDEWDRRVHPDDKEQCYADLKRHLSGETPFYENEHRVLCKDGTYKWILDRGKIIERTEDGKPLRVIGTRSSSQNANGQKRRYERVKNGSERCSRDTTPSCS